jgi:hypothetical protein
MKNKNFDYDSLGVELRPGDPIDQTESILPLPTPSPTSAGRTRLRHAAITDTLGRFRSYENWANRVRGAWK